MEPWARTAVHLALVAALGAWALESILRRRQLMLPRSSIDLPVALVLAWAAVAAAVSLCPQPSWLEVSRLVGGAAFYVLSAVALRRRQSFFAVAWALALLGAAVATLGLTVYGSDLLGFRTFSERSHRLSLTFANPNHFAALLSMLACFTLGLAAACRGGRRVGLVLCALYLQAAVFFTASRAGLGALAAALAVLLGGLLAYGRREALRPLAAAVALAALAAALMGPQLPLKRLETLRDPWLAASGRWEIWQATWQIVRRHPWTGTGPGTFRDAITPYQPPRLSDRFLQHAHNDYLELAAGAGLPALALALLAVAVFSIASLQGLGRAGPRRQAIGLGAFSGCVALLLHSLADFNLHIPVNAWLLAVLAAFSLTALPRPASRLALDSFPQRGLTALACALAAAAAAVAVLTPYLATRRLAEARQLSRQRDFEAAGKILESALRWPLAEAALRAELGSAELALAVQEGDGERRKGSLDGARAHLQAACRECPLRADYFVQLGTAARLGGRFEEAEDALEHAVELAPLKAAPRFQLAGFFLQQRRVTEAVTAYGEALELDPRLAEPVFDALDRAGFPIDRIRRAFPETADLRALLAEILKRRSLEEAAADELRRAFELSPAPERASRHLEALFRQGRDQLALELAGEYRRRFPTETNLIRQTIAILRRLDRPAEAEVLYRRLIELDPADPRPYAALATMLCQGDRDPEALELFGQGLERAPASAELEFRLGLCHRLHGRHHPALEALMKAAALEPAEKLYRFHLGEQLRLLGLRYRAEAELRACLDIDPGFGRCRSALARLDFGRPGR